MVSNRPTTTVQQQGRTKHHMRLPARLLPGHNRAYSHTHTQTHTYILVKFLKPRNTATDAHTPSREARDMTLHCKSHTRPASSLFVFLPRPSHQVAAEEGDVAIHQSVCQLNAGGLPGHSARPHRDGDTLRRKREGGEDRERW
jgi:hypothetical protein